MRIEKKFRHSIEKKVAPYRGVSEQTDFVNTTLEILHDMLEIALASGDKGHAEEIRGRMKVLVAGGEGDFRSNIYQVGRIAKTEAIEIPSDLRTWTKSGGVSVVEGMDGYVISEEGLLDPAGITWNIDVEAGDELMMVLHVKGLTGKTDEVMFGATRINMGEESLKKVNATKDSSGVYVDKRLYCQQRETVEIGVFLHRIPETLAAGSIEIMEMSVWKISSTEVSMKGIETESKTEMMHLREHIESMRK